MITRWPTPQQYMGTVLADAHLQEWLAAAATELWTANTEAVGL